ncbi:MAG: cytochrome c3 family protein [Cyclobacteriaceae bacterium]|nr:cytochrome c3 family protein [Cyclobacteriaceae bacterium]
MKTIRLFSVMLFIGCTVQFSFGQLTSTMSGGPHDFSAKTWNITVGATGTNEVCNVCHAPHNTNAVAGTPLWNHGYTAVTTYTMYSGFDLQGTIGTAPDATSKLCLSCHDGTVAVDSYGAGTSAGAGTLFIGDINTNFNVGGGSIDAGGNPVGGGDLSNDHPISITYPATDLELRAITEASGIGTGTIESDLLYGVDNKVECASCHDVHTNTTDLLRIANDGSALCLTCHIK